MGELAPKLVEDKRVKNAFATLLYKDLYREAIKVGDSEPVFWFNNETEDIIVGILSKTEELILFKYNIEMVDNEMIYIKAKFK